MDGNNNFEDIIKNVFSNVLKDYEKSGKPIFKDGKERTPEEAEKEISEMQSKIINFSRKNEEAENQKILYNIDEIIEKIDKEMPPLPMTHSSCLERAYIILTRFSSLTDLKKDASFST